MATKQVHPESGNRTAFCAVDTEYPGSEADNQAMGFHVRRSIKLLPAIRLNFGKRGAIRCFAPHLSRVFEAAPSGARRRQASSSTSIGARGANVTFGKTGTRTTAGLPGSDLSFTHLDKQRRERLVVLHPSLNSGAFPARDWRGLLWIALIVSAIAAAAAQAMK
jgi:hypothetical protein